MTLLKFLILKGFFTDKSLFNFLHLGFIKGIFQIQKLFTQQEIQKIIFYQFIKTALLV